MNHSGIETCGIILCATDNLGTNWTIVELKHALGLILEKDSTELIEP